jgi:hypothetical protein
LRKPCQAGVHLPVLGYAAQPLRSRIRQLARALLPVLALALAAGGLSACGGGDEDDAKQKLEQAFAKPIDNADLNADIELRVRGVPQLRDPIRIKVTGPFKSNAERSLPSWNLELAIAGGGSTFERRILSTGDRAFVQVDGSWYEVDPDDVERSNRNYRRQARENKGRRGIRALGVDPLSWVVDAKNEGSEEVAGAETDHISGQLDVGKMLADLNRLVQRTGGSLGEDGQRVPELTEQQLKDAEQIVRDPRFDVYVGQDDDRIHRFAADLDVEVPEQERSALGGIQGGTVSAAFEFQNVGKVGDIDAPRNARPLSDLGGLGALGGSGRGGSGGQAAPQPSEPSEPESGGGSGGSSNQERFERYAECLEQAGGDAAAQERCQSVLSQ